MRLISILNIYFLLCFSVTVHAQTMKNTVQNSEPNSEKTQSINQKNIPFSSLKKVGEGQMKVMFWKVYIAEFFSLKTPYNEDIYPKALKLTYQRDIEKQAFIEATQDQWQKLNKHFPQRLVSQAKEDEWLKQLNDIFPNIKTDDVIIFTLNNDKVARFFLTTNKNSDESSFITLGQINDTAFGEYFLSIWLSERTTEPKLRKKLLAL